MSEFLKCVIESDVLHFKDNFIKEKKYEITKAGDLDVITAEDGVKYPVDIGNHSLIDMDITFNLKPKFVPA